MRRLGSVVALVGAAALALAACVPSPEAIRLEVRAGGDVAVGSDLPESVAMNVGDLVAVEASPVDDDDDAMKLCLEVTSSAPDVVSVTRAEGPCDEPRVFVLGGKRPGTSRVRFGARGTWRDIVVTVRP